MITATAKATVLAVDDNPTALKLLQFLLEQGDYRVLTACGGPEALEILATNEVDILLLDRMMPGMDGIEVCARIKADERLRAIPIIMQTAAGRPQEIREGIEAGVFYYLVKPLSSETLLSIVESARQKIRKFRQDELEDAERRQSLALIRSLTCVFKTIEEGEKLASFLAAFFPHPDLALTGISELFLNAVEHGNLAIDYRLKSQLVQTNSWQQEIARRQLDPLYCNRVVTVVLERDPGSCSLRIEDQGEGFDARCYLEMDPSRATDNHGRGIAIANMMCFDRLSYNDRGNVVTAISSTTNRSEMS